MRILNLALYEVLHPFALLSINSLFDVLYALVLLFGLSINETVAKVHFS